MLRKEPHNLKLLRGYAMFLHSEGRYIEAEAPMKQAMACGQNRDVSTMCAYAVLMWDTDRKVQAERMVNFKP